MIDCSASKSCCFQVQAYGINCASAAQRTQKAQYTIYVWRNVAKLQQFNNDVSAARWWQCHSQMFVWGKIPNNVKQSSAHVFLVYQLFVRILKAFRPHKFIYKPMTIRRKICFATSLALHFAKYGKWWNVFQTNVRIRSHIDSFATRQPQWWQTHNERKQNNSCIQAGTCTGTHELSESCDYFF